MRTTSSAEVLRVAVSMLALVCGLCVLEAAAGKIAFSGQINDRSKLNRTVEVPKEIVQQLSHDEDLKECFETRNGGVAKNLRAEFIELNHDGIPELLVEGIGSCICGVNNCDTWIYRKTAYGYQLILEAGTINHIEFKKTFINGYRDLVAATHHSAFESGLAVYTFDGKKYQLKECFQRSYSSTDRRQQPPRIKRVKCD